MNVGRVTGNNELNEERLNRTEEEKNPGIKMNENLTLDTH